MAKKLNFGAARSSNSFGLFVDQETDWVFKRTLEMMSEKAAEIGECLYAASLIDPKDIESWVREWADLAHRVEELAEKSLAGGHTISAREGFLKACNYFRSAEYGCSPNHPLFHELWQKSVGAFQQACKLFDPPIQIVEIPFEGHMLPGYFWSPDDKCTTRPTMIAAGGNDSSGEEIFIVTGFGAVRRGYNYFTFEYPGHRGAVHLDPGAIKRPDVEVPFKAAIDFLENLPGVDERIALAGFSYGGYVATRVAMYEDRVKAVIADSPIVNLPALLDKGMLGPMLKTVPPGMLDRFIEKTLAKKAPMVKALLDYSAWTWGMPSFSKAVSSPAYQQHVITNQLDKVICPALGLVGQGEGEEMICQADIFINGISSQNKKLHIFSLEADGSNDHCQLDNLSRAHQIAYDWLDDIFGYAN